MRRPGLGWALAALLVAPIGASGQVFQLRGGGSSLFEGYGGALNMWGNGYEASLGVGYLDGIRIGMFARRLLSGRDTLRLGNDALPFVLGTDIFGGGSAILAQGLSLQRRRGRTTLHAFAGASANALAAPYFAANTPSRAMGYLHATYDVSRLVSLESYAVFTNRQTLLGALRWRPALGISTSATAGVGSDAPYAATTVDARTGHFDIKAAYAFLGDGFRRASAPMPLQSEMEKENLVVTYRPSAGFAVTLGRQHFRQDSTFRGVPQRATLNQLSANATLLGATMSSGVFLSEAGRFPNTSTFLSARRSLTSRLESELYVLQVWEPEPARVTTPVLLLRETITPQLGLLQVITRSQGRTSVSFGGTLNTGLSSISLDYQVAHSPYLTANPFVQTIGINARLQVGGYLMSLGSFVTPDGRVHYSAQGSTFLYRGMSAATGALYGGGAPSRRLDPFLVQGRVVDEIGTPIEGAALDIGGELVYTDSRGRFFQRRAVSRKLTLRIVLDDFLIPGTFAVVRAPGELMPAREEHTVPVEIVLKRVLR